MKDIPGPELSALPQERQAAPRERLWLALAALALFAAGAGFWVTNGARTFGEAMLGAFSLCF